MERAAECSNDNMQWQQEGGGGGGRDDGGGGDAAAQDGGCQTGSGWCVHAMFWARAASSAKGGESMLAKI
jgi:hypothetical protein